MFHLGLFLLSLYTPSFADVAPPEDTSSAEDTSTQDTAPTDSTDDAAEKTGCSTIQFQTSLFILPVVLLVMASRRERA